MKKSTKYLVCLSTLLLTLPLASCAGTPAHEHKYVNHDEVLSTCHTKGHDFYYTCEGCDKIFDVTKKEIASIPVTDLNPENHEHEKCLEVKDGHKTAYSVGDTFELKKDLFLWKCDLCSGVSIKESDKSLLKVTYPTVDATSFTVEDIGKEGLFVTVSIGKLMKKIAVTVGKRVNVITGLKDIGANCGLLGAGLKEILNMDVTASAGTLQFSICETKDGTYRDIKDDESFDAPENEESKKWFIKAAVAETSEYSKVEAGPVELTITHNHAWNKDDEDHDYYGCLCKPESVIDFSKTTTNTADIVFAGDAKTKSITLDLTGSGYVKEGFFGQCDVDKVAIKVNEQEVVLGESLTLDENALETLAKTGLFGEQTIYVTVRHGDISAVGVKGTDHVIKVKALLVTREITIPNEIRSMMCNASGTPSEVLGYYRLGKDLDARTTAMAEYPDFNHINIFKGVFDGNNKTLTMQSRLYGLFGTLDGAHIKNITLTDLWTKLGSEFGSTMLAHDVKNTLIENVKIKAIGGNTLTIKPLGANVQGYGWVCSRICTSTTYVNCDFNAAEVGKNVTTLFGCHPSNSDVTFEKSTFETITYGCLYQINDPTPGATEPKSVVKTATGLQITSEEQSGTTRQDILLTSESPISLTIPEKYQEYTPEEIFVKDGANKIDLGKDPASILLPDTLKTKTELHGENNIHIKFIKDGNILNVSFPVLFITKNISTQDEFIALCPSTQTTVYGYYVLANDINVDVGGRGYTSGWDKMVFAGTIEGNNHKLTLKQSAYGQFYILNGAKFKNMSIYCPWYQRTTSERVLMCQKALNTVFENVTFDKPVIATGQDGEYTPVNKYGFIIGTNQCVNVSFINCDFNFNGLNIPTLIGHSNNMPASNNVSFTNSTITCDVLGEVYATKDTSVTTVEGLTIIKG